MNRNRDREKDNAYSREYYRNNKDIILKKSKEIYHDTSGSYSIKRFEKLKSDGLCPRCSSPNDSSLTYCSSCRKKISEQKMCKKQERDSFGLCIVCGLTRDIKSKKCSVCKKNLSLRVYKYNKTKKGKDTISQQRKKYSQTPQYKSWYKNYLIKRRKTNIQFKLRNLLRNRVLKLLGNRSMVGSAVRDLGCSIDFFKSYLEGKFLTGMTWDNHGKGADKWNIDHIIPLSSVDLTSRDQFLKVCRYTNLQPLWSIENLKKGNKTLWIK